MTNKKFGVIIESPKLFNCKIDKLIKEIKSDGLRPLIILQDDLCSREIIDNKKKYDIIKYTNHDLTHTNFLVLKQNPYKDKIHNWIISLNRLLNNFDAREFGITDFTTIDDCVLYTNFYKCFYYRDEIHNLYFFGDKIEADLVANLSDIIDIKNVLDPKCCSTSCCNVSFIPRKRSNEVLTIEEGKILDISVAISTNTNLYLDLNNEKLAEEFNGVIKGTKKKVSNINLKGFSVNDLTDCNICNSIFVLNKKIIEEKEISVAKDSNFILNQNVDGNITLGKSERSEEKSNIEISFDHNFVINQEVDNDNLILTSGNNKNIKTIDLVLATPEINNINNYKK